MTWVLVGALAAGTLALKTFGPIVAGGVQPPPALVRVIDLITPALLTALIVVSTFSDGRALVLDARAAGVVSGSSCCWFAYPLSRPWSWQRWSSPGSACLSAEWFVAVRQHGPMADVEIKNNQEQNRYEAWLGDELAGYADYELRGESIAFVHTVVDDKYEGEGVGSTLAREALDDVRRDGELEVIVECPFIKEWISRHSDYEHLLA